MYRNILIPVAFDTEHRPGAALRVARALASDGARITFLHVMDEAPAFAISYMPEGYEGDLEQAVRAELDTLAARIPGGAGAILRGHPARSILDWAEANEADCIVIDSHRPGLEDYFLGSTAARVVRQAQCSVHVMR